ncbi:MAG: ThuA domain-containing protein [Cyclobacteriaceae bacterium]|nr:ThuA domain-containing protein [Cyclobacteriaceae bacterium]
MRKTIFLVIKKVRYLLIVALPVLLSQCDKPASLSAVILAEQEVVAAEPVKAILENTGLFDADIKSNNFADFNKYDLVVLSTSKISWSDDVKAAFETYLKNGGGLVILNSAANAFPEWDAFAAISGVKPLESRSSEPFEFEIMEQKVEHPITKGLPGNWLHMPDYLLFNTSYLPEDVEILAAAKADTLYGGDGQILPVLFTVKYGEGRIFHTTLGTAPASMQCVGFIATLQRGAEWAATGVVSQAVPVDFPNSVSTHEWIDYKPLTIDEILNKAATYEVGKSKKYLTDFSMQIKNSDGKPETYAMFEDKILEFLQSDATVDSKRYMCHELSWMGSEKSIAVLDNLINNKDLSEAASYALYRLRM